MRNLLLFLPPIVHLPNDETRPTAQPQRLETSPPVCLQLHLPSDETSPFFVTWLHLFACAIPNCPDHCSTASVTINLSFRHHSLSAPFIRIASTAVVGSKKAQTLSWSLPLLSTPFEFNDYKATILISRRTG